MSAVAIASPSLERVASDVGSGRAIWLPYPPTTNNLFFNAGKRRVRSKGYDAWIEHALLEVRRQRPTPIAGPYRLSLVAHRPDRRRRDLGNIEKPISDLLVKAGVIADDSDATRIMLTWSTEAPSKDGGVLIYLTAGQNDRV